MVRLARRPSTLKIAIHMAAADDVSGCVYFCVVFSHMVSWVGSGIELWQFMRIFLLRLTVSRPDNFIRNDCKRLCLAFS